MRIEEARKDIPPSSIDIFRRLLIGRHWTWYCSVIAYPNKIENVTVINTNVQHEGNRAAPDLEEVTREKNS